MPRPDMPDDKFDGLLILGDAMLAWLRDKRGLSPGDAATVLAVAFGKLMGCVDTKSTIEAQLAAFTKVAMASYKLQKLN